MPKDILVKRLIRFLSTSITAHRPSGVCDMAAGVASLMSPPGRDPNTAGQKRFRTVASILIIFFSSALLANNIQVNVAPSLTDQNTASSPKYVYVKFDFSWDNSWCDATNWDAAWVFVKYKISGSTWQHATLSTTAGDHSITTDNGVGGTVTPSSDGKGVWIYRSATGTGSNNWDGVLLKWNYGTNGVPDNAALSIRVFAIEMVRIPAGNLYLNTTASANMYSEFGSTTGSLASITSEAALAAGVIKFAGESGYYGGNGNSDALGANYPKGYGAFYCMKHEISQQEYCDFLNTLTRTQQCTRVAATVSGDAPGGNNVYVMSNTSAISIRNAITCPASGNGTTNPIVFSVTVSSNSKGDRACNWLTWMDGCAYADWAALRPMTELEFEKACRGDQVVVTDEFAWGNTTITAAVAISGTENGTETITTANANCCYGNVTFTGGDAGQGPLRCGIFATSSTTRGQAGAGYYGVMELSGNLYEQCVTVAYQDINNAYDTWLVSNAGLFDGSSGDGVLATDGNANGNSTWPGYLTSEVTGDGNPGWGWRGGSWNTAASYERTSDRYYAGWQALGRYNYVGFRCVRSVSGGAKGAKSEETPTSKPVPATHVPLQKK